MDKKVNKKKATVYLGREVGIDGKTKSKVTTVYYTTQEEKEEKIALVKKKYKAKKQKENGKLISFRDFEQSWEKELESPNEDDELESPDEDDELESQDEEYNSITESSLKRKLHYAHYLVDCFGDTPMEEITVYDVKKSLIEYARMDRYPNYKNNKNKTLSRDTVRKVMYVYNSIAEHARERGCRAVKCNKNLVNKIVKKPAKRRRALKPYEIDIIVNSPEHPFKLIAMLMLFSGMRRSEALALRWGKINLTEHKITVDEFLDMQKSPPELKDSGKTENADRDIPIPSVLVDYLAEYKEKHNCQNGDYVFLNSKGKENIFFTSSAFRDQWNEYMLFIEEQCKKEGVKFERYTSHYLRHTYCTLLCLQGVPAENAKIYMGHSCYSTTSDIYTHINKSYNPLDLSEEIKRKLINEYALLDAAFNRL